MNLIFNNMNQISINNSSQSSYIYMAIEADNIEHIHTSLITSGGLRHDQIIIAPGDCPKKNFNIFKLIANLYIWTDKYWYGTYYKKLIYVRLKNVPEVPLFFLIKYGSQIRLAIKSKFAYIVKDIDVDLLKQVNYESTNHFNEQRIIEITPFIKKLESKWQLLIYNNNPYT